MFFFISKDRQFIIKTLTNEDLRVLINSLELLHNHWRDNKSSLLSRIYGAFSIEIDSFSPIHVMIMENCLPEIKSYELNHVFDIKGSRFSREVLGHRSYSRMMRDPITKGKVLKDIDFERLQEMRKFMMLGKQDWKDLVAAANKDTKMLRDFGLMDYSLLLSIRRVSEMHPVPRQL